MKAMVRCHWSGLVHHQVRTGLLARLEELGEVVDDRRGQDHCGEESHALIVAVGER